MVRLELYNFTEPLLSPGVAKASEISLINFGLRSIIALKLN